MLDLAGGQPADVEASVKAPAQRQGRDPARQEGQPVVRRAQLQASQRRRPPGATLQQPAQRQAVAVAREAALGQARHQHAQLLEQLAHSGGAREVGLGAVLRLHAAAREDVRVGRELRTSRPPHHQHLEGRPPAQDEH